MVLQSVPAKFSRGRPWGRNEDQRETNKMLETPTANHGVMEGEGSYNRHASIPTDSMALSLPLLEKAVRNIEFDGECRSVTVADYGSSQGRNSLAPMNVAIRTLRKSLGPDQPICVCHVDQPGNDFNTLFEVLSTDPDRYSLDEPNVFPCAIGKSFYEQVLPSGQVDLGWSAYAAQWLSRIPAHIPDHFISLLSKDSVHTVFEHQAAKDWKAFLTLRARELRRGGRLVVVLPGVSDDGKVGGIADLFNHVNDVLAEMVDAGEINNDERQRMVIGVHPLRSRELVAPFVPTGQFQDLTVERCELAPLPDSAWTDYERNGNLEVLITKHAKFFRSIFVPSFALALIGAHDAELRQVFADRVENRLKQRLLNQPVQLFSFVQMLVLAKGTAAPN